MKWKFGRWKGNATAQSNWTSGRGASQFIRTAWTVKLFNVTDGAILRTFTHHKSIIQCLALHPDGRRFVSGVYPIGMHDPEVDKEGPSMCIVEHGLAPCPEPAYAAFMEEIARFAAGRA